MSRPAHAAQPFPDAATIARGVETDIATLPERSVDGIRRIRKRLTAELKHAPPKLVKQACIALAASGRTWFAYELLSSHPGALAALSVRDVERLAGDMASWDAVDAFGVLLSGPAWKAGVLADADIIRWAKSADLWMRRAALVSTVPLNTKSRGGTGDARRTLAICVLLAADREDMVVKALSWALRCLVPWDRSAVEAFLARHDATLAARVKREVGNKLRTGLKTPKRA